MNDLLCPKCSTKIEREYGISAVLYRCPKCDEEWVMCLGELITREEFHQRAADEQ